MGNNDLHPGRSLDIPYRGMKRAPRLQRRRLTGILPHARIEFVIRFSSMEIVTMRLLLSFAGCFLLLSSVATAAQIRGEYLEARTCDVYTGPCFANAEMDQSGKEAVMAWRVESGHWGETDVAGLTVALIVTADNTIGHDGIFAMKARRFRSVILVDRQASDQQRDALVAFVRHSTGKLSGHVVSVQQTPMKLENDHLSGKGLFSAGKLARIETRGLKHGDCVCTNEDVFYQPLTKIKDFIPAYSQTVSFEGKGLDNRFTTHNLRSAFLGTFRY